MSRIAARTYRAWKSPVRIAARTVTDALVEDKIRNLAWTFNEVTGQIQMTRPQRDTVNTQVEALVEAQPFY